MELTIYFKDNSHIIIDNVINISYSDTGKIRYILIAVDGELNRMYDVSIISVMRCNFE